MVKLVNTGEVTENEVVFEDDSNPEARVESDFSPAEHAPSSVGADVAAVTHEGNVVIEDEPQNGDTAEATATTEAPEGGNVNPADDKRTKKRQRTALNRRINAIGEAYGAGKTSMIELAEEVTEAAVARTIGPTDAEDIYKEFRNAANDRATIDNAGTVPDPMTEETSLVQQVSKLRVFIHLGNQMEEALDIVRSARNVHLDLLKGDRRGVKKGSTYTILGSVAREAMEDKYAGVPMTEEQIRDFLEVPIIETATPDGAKKIRQALDLAEAARKGSPGNAKGEGYRAPVESVALDEAIQSLYQALGDASAEAQAAYDKEKADAEAAKLEKERKKNEAKSKGKKAAA